MEMLAATALTFIGNKDARKMATDAFHSVAKGADSLTGSLRRKAPHHVSARGHAAAAAPHTAAASSHTAAASKPHSIAPRAARTNDRFTPSAPSADQVRHANEQAELKRHMAGLRSGQLLAERRADGKLHFVPNPDAPERSAWAAHADYLANGYGTDVMNFGHGEVVGMGTVVKDTAVGLSQMALHPVDTATGLRDAARDAVAHPVDTIHRGAHWVRNTAHSIAEPFQKGDFEGMGNVVGKGLGYAGIALATPGVTRAATARVSSVAQAGARQMSVATARMSTVAQAGLRGATNVVGRAARFAGEMADEINEALNALGRAFKGDATPRLPPPPSAPPSIPQVSLPRPTAPRGGTGWHHVGPATDLTERVSPFTPTGVDVGAGDWMSNMEKLRRMAQGGR